MHSHFIMTFPSFHFTTLTHPSHPHHLKKLKKKKLKKKLATVKVAIDM
jgi:hypothetical protein